MSVTLREIARATGGKVDGRQVLCPGPGHSRTDSSLSIRLSHQSPTGWIVFSHSGDDFRVARDYVAAKLGLGPNAWKREKLRQFGDSTSATDKLSFADASANLADASDNAARIARARAIWDGAGPALGSIVETYFASRGLDLGTVDNIHGCLRFHPRCPWRDEAESRTVYVPAMVALMRSVTTDEPQAIHRTRLTPKGKKVGRRMLGIAAGAAVKLDADDTVTMGLTIGEGIETCLAARQLGLRPAWALGSAGAVSAFPVLGGVEALTILAENDPTNRTAVETCAARWHAAGREVIVVEPVAGSDILDSMREAG